MAASAAALEIIDIFSDVIKNNLQYCSLCLRTERDRKMVEPVSYRKCVRILKITQAEVGTVCFVCEAAATQALALMQNISFSCILSRWFKEVAKKPKRLHLQYTAKQLDNLINKTEPGWVKRPLTVEWGAARRRHDLEQTEVLVVSTEGKTEGGADKEKQPESRSGKSQRITEIENSIVLIETDDEDSAPASPSSILNTLLAQPSRPPRNPPVTARNNPVTARNNPVTARNNPSVTARNNPSVTARNNPSVTARNNPSVTARNNPSVTARNNPSVTARNNPSVTARNNPSVNISYHPLLTTIPCKVFTKPEEGLPEMVPFQVFMNNFDLNTAALMPNEMKIITRHKDDKTSFVLHPIIQTEKSELYVPTLPARLIAGRLVPHTPQLFSDLIAVPTDIHATDTHELGVEVMSQGHLIPCSESEDNTQGVPEPTAPSEPRPVPGGRIDWEDKIPMDVISFMDATDPHADQILNMDAPKKPRNKRKLLDSPVIDLC